MAGERKTFLVIIDDTPECERALLFAARLAERAGGQILALFVQPDSEFQHWLGVENLMREEAVEEANMLIDKVVGAVAERIDADIERKVVFGNRSEAIRSVIQESNDIAQLVLAAAPGSDGPGPLVTAIATGQSGAYPIPITIVPGTLSDAVIDAIA